MMLASPLSPRPASRGYIARYVLVRGSLLQVIAWRSSHLLDNLRCLEKEKEGGRKAVGCSLGIFGFELLFVATLQASQNSCYLP